jgi:hypothetical protein
MQSDRKHRHRGTPMRFRGLRAPRARLAAAALAAALALALPGPAAADETPPPAAPAPASPARQALDDAWWTGPLLANSAAGAAPGHLLVEPYLYDVTTEGRFDSHGVRRATPYENGFGSQTYIVYGLTGRVAVGMIPNAGFNTVAGGLSSAGPGLGDFSLIGQVLLTAFHPGSWLPGTAFNVQETFPSGRYDRLGDRPSDGLGAGAYTTTLSLYSQTYLWLPNGRILRLRLDTSQSLSSGAGVEGVSVYGTAAGFRGHASPGGALVVDAAAEYSLTRRWVLASDLFYRQSASTRLVGGIFGPDGLPLAPTSRTSFGAGNALGLAPAVEFNWRPNLGVIVGTRIVAAGRNTAATFTPAVAVNYVH